MGSARRNHQAALDPLSPDDALLKHLGTNAPKLAHYCWLGDYRRTPYEPYFRRALQALRTETPLNAARWIGSLLKRITITPEK